MLRKWEGGYLGTGTRLQTLQTLIIKARGAQPPPSEGLGADLQLLEEGQVSSSDHQAWGLLEGQLGPLALRPPKLGAGLPTTFSRLDYNGLSHNFQDIFFFLELEMWCQKILF